MVTPRGADSIAVLQSVTAVSGVSASLTLSVEWSHTGGDTFAVADGTADALSTTTTTGAKVKRFTAKGDHYRLVWTITGTLPSVTFTATVYGI